MLFATYNAHPATSVPCVTVLYHGIIAAAPSANILFARGHKKERMAFSSAYAYRRIFAPLFMTNDVRFKILMVAAEAVPFAKEGGVADVIGSLPKELAALGHEVCIFLPRYGSIDFSRWDIKHTGVVRTFFLAGADR